MEENQHEYELLQQHYSTLLRDSLTHSTMVPKFRKRTRKSKKFHRKNYLICLGNFDIIHMNIIYFQVSICLPFSPLPLWSGHRTNLHKSSQKRHE